MGIDRQNVIFAGVGGMGALTSGLLLAQAAMKKFKHVTWYPNITTARRNAPADCLVCLSDRMIYSQLVTVVETAVVMNNIQLEVIIPRIRKNGLLILEEEDLTNEIEREDITVIKVPGIKISSRIGNPRGINILYLGVYVGATKIVSPEMVEVELRERFKGKREVQKVNLEAYEEGVKFGAAS